jgi:hypothetical protein
MRSFALAVFCVFALARAASAAEPLDQVYACAAISESAARLACYDAAVGKLKSAEQSGDLAVVDSEKVRQVQKESFGFRLPSLPKLVLPKFGGGEPESVTAKLERLRTNSEYKAVFYLENGQVWRQIDTNTTTRIKPGQIATVRKAALGSFMLTTPQAGQAIRVHRDE